MVEEKENEQQGTQSNEGTEEQGLPGQPLHMSEHPYEMGIDLANGPDQTVLSGEVGTVKGFLDRSGIESMTPEQLELDDEARAVVDEILGDKVVSDEEYLQLVENAKEQIVQRKNQLDILKQAAKNDLEYLKPSDIVGSMITSVKGLREPYMIHMGRFVYGKNGSWIYNPDNSQMMTNVKRFKDIKKVKDEVFRLRKYFKEHGAEVKQDLIRQLDELKVTTINV